jgi:hypothetical protein
MAKNKPWARSRRGRAAQGSRERRKVVIFCEDTKSSRLYLKSFPVDRERFEVSVLGTGMNTDSLVEEAVRRVKQATGRGVIFSEIWCVFDRDSFPESNYIRAFQLADQAGIKIAWANEAFELWYILHFDYLETGLSRTDYKQKLKERGLEYDKADEGIYGKLRDRQETAIKNARRLESYWYQNRSRFPERENPSTSVHRLVSFLNELSELPKVN